MRTIQNLHQLRLDESLRTETTQNQYEDVIQKLPF